MTQLDEELLKLMQCPIGRAPVVQMGDWVCSTDANTRRKYPIRDGIPIMLAEEAVQMEPAEFDRVLEQLRKAQP